MNLIKYAVRNDKGEVDTEATVAKFRSDLISHLASQRDQDNKIAVAVHAVFDQYKGARINLPALTNFTLTKLEANASNYPELTNAIRDYVKSNASEGGLFLINKGKGGGVIRLSDLK